jgi:hypothetical protein
MSLLNIGTDSVLEVVSFLTRKEAGKLACVSKKLRNDIEHEKYLIYQEVVYDVDHPEWGKEYDNEHLLTKERALKRVDELKENPLCVQVQVSQGCARLGWVANFHNYERNWEREAGGVWRLVNRVDGCNCC